MKTSNKMTIALSLGSFIPLMGWINTYSGSCISLIFPFISVCVICVGVMELSVKKRECLARSYFVEGTFLYKFFNSRQLVFIKSLFLSILLGMSLALSLITWDSGIMYLLFGDIFLLSWIYSKTLSTLTGTIKENVKFVIAKDLAVSINSFFLLILLLLIQFTTPIPEYVDASLQTTLTSALTVFSSECAVTNFLLMLNAQKDAFSWWTMLNIDSHIHDQKLRYITWLAFLLTNGLATYAFSRYTLQLLDLVRVFGDKNAQQ